MRSRGVVRLKNRKELDLLIEQVGLKDKISSFEKGTDTMLFKAFDEDGVEFSGGEQQKIAIARALFRKSPVDTVQRLFDFAFNYSILMRKVNRNYNLFLL